MANFSYTQDGILFNNLNNSPQPIKKVTGKLFNTNNDYEYASEDGIQYSLDAITLDWNGAKLGSTIINTTGQLLSYITTLSNRIAALENGGGSSKPATSLTGSFDRSSAWYNTYYLVRVKVQRNTLQHWPVTVTNNDATISLINNTYYNYSSDVSDKETSRFTSVQLNGFNDYITIVTSGSAVPTSNTLTFSTAETSAYAPTSINFNYSFTKK